MSLFDLKQRCCVAICTPMPAKQGPHGLVYDTISPRWHRARNGLSMPTNFNTVELFADGMEVGDARSRIAARCLELESQPEFLLFLDYDVLMPPDAFTKLFFRARTLPDYDIYAGVYCCKWHSPPDPLIYGEHGQGSIWDWAVGDILTTESHGVKTVHMGLTLIRVSAFQKLLDAGLVHGDGTDQDDCPFFKTTDETRTVDAKSGAGLTKAGTEDVFFCDLLSRIGGKILVDTSVLAGHEDKRTGVVYGLPMDRYGPSGRAKWLGDGKGNSADREEAKGGPCDCGSVRTPESTQGWVWNPSPTAETPCQYYRRDCPKCRGLGTTQKKLALDIGAGGTRRHWDGYVTYTTDIRADTKPDYVQDTRLLNFPEGHWNLTASSHHLEHLGRWDQETVWKEIFRVTAPGGHTEHIVPNIEWAAQKVVDKEIDGHVLNVLYGAQEEHGYPRLYNTHFFGYTPEIAVALAEQAGFVDVTTESWKENDGLGYNLIVRGTKPTLVPDFKPDTTEKIVEAAVSILEGVEI